LEGGRLREGEGDGEGELILEGWRGEEEKRRNEIRY